MEAPADATRRPALSLVTDYGAVASGCGYCGSEDDTSWAHGMQAEFMTVETYQALLDRGWRRSGRWMYKPLHARSCCQLITIRLDVDKFVPTKDQRKVQRRWDAHLAGAPLRHTPAALPEPEAPLGGSPKRMREESGDLDWDIAERELQGGGKRQRSAHNLAAMDDEAWARAASPTAELTEQLQIALGAQRSLEAPNGDASSPAAPLLPEPAQKPAASLEEQLAQELQAALRRCVDDGQLPDVGYPAPRVARPTPKQRKNLPVEVAYTSPMALAVSGMANRAERGNERETAPDPLSAESAARLIIDKMELPDGIVGVEVAAGHLNFKAPGAVAAAQTGAASKPPAGAITSRAATATPPGAIPRSPRRHFELRMVPSSDPALPRIEFDLYKKYQVVHHGDTPSSVGVRSFVRFLCDSPLVAAPASSYPPGGAPPCGFGSFHQQYWLDGRLIAVGVIDVLPRALSSKYLFWDPDLGPLSLGKLASLQEIEWVRTAHAACPSLRYYYLGFYLHTCHRMRYKAEFGPSDLLCPVNQCWVPIDRVRAVLDSGATPPSLSQQPGALEGLGDEYLVGSDGKPTVPPTQPTADEVGEVKLFVAVGSTGAARRGQVVTFQKLLSLGLLSEEMAAHMKQRLEDWMVMVGPVWRSMVYKFE